MKTPNIGSIHDALPLRTRRMIAVSTGSVTHRLNCQNGVRNIWLYHWFMVQFDPPNIQTFRYPGT